MSAHACDECLRRTWLVGRLAGHLDQHRDRVDELMALPANALIEAVAGRRRNDVQRAYTGFGTKEADSARTAARAAGVELVCACRPPYPVTLRRLHAPPAVLHVAGGLGRLNALLDQPTVAIVGAREPSAYGAELAQALGRGLAASGVPVISGMARGIDTRAHRGALDAGGSTLAVLAGAAERPYPSRGRALHARIRETGVVVSEQPTGTSARRWMFPARNRLIAALASLTVVVEARSGSGALLTAQQAHAMAKPVGAVPGRVTSPLARGPHQLLRDGARLITGPQDVLDILFGPGNRPVRCESTDAALTTPERALLTALAEGDDAQTAAFRAGLGPLEAFEALAGLEMAGRLKRGMGGRYLVSL